jgi:hypothetical protein
LGLLTVSGWVIGAVDFPRGVEMVVFVVAFTAVGQALGRASNGDASMPEGATRGS